MAVSDRYPFPWRIVGLLALAILGDKQRSFRIDSMTAVEALRPPLKVIGTEPVPGPYVITINHYARPGFQAWWLALAVSATLPVEVRWVATSAWRFPDKLRTRTITPISGWFLKRVATVYGFILMPPMPPRPNEAQKRAQAVREILRYARFSNCPVLGLAPEGGDFSSPGKMAELPAGSGRLILHLAELGLVVLPVGALEVDGQFCLNFGSPYHLEPPPGSDPKSRDAWARQVVRERIEALLEK
jgi:hypothetical protein